MVAALNAGLRHGATCGELHQVYGVHACARQVQGAVLKLPNARVGVVALPSEFFFSAVLVV